MNEPERPGDERAHRRRGSDRDGGGGPADPHRGRRVPGHLRRQRLIGIRSQRARVMQRHPSRGRSRHPGPPHSHAGSHRHRGHHDPRAPYQYTSAVPITPGFPPAGLRVFTTHRHNPPRTTTTNAKPVGHQPFTQTVVRPNPSIRTIGPSSAQPYRRQKPNRASPHARRHASGWLRWGAPVG